jgi:hypothetical protein
MAQGLLSSFYSLIHDDVVTLILIKPLGGVCRFAREGAKP